MPGRLEIHQSEVNKLLYATSGPVVRKVTADTRRVQSYARAYAPVDKGPLRSSITAEVAAQPSQNRVVGVVGSRLPYAIYQEKGTGIYGPRGAPIRPKRAKRLVFVPKGGSQVVFAREVRGARPQRYLERALSVVAVSSGYGLRIPGRSTPRI